MQSLARQSLRSLPWRRVPNAFPRRAFGTSPRPFIIESPLESQQRLRIRLVRPPINIRRIIFRALLIPTAIVTAMYFYGFSISIEVSDDEEDGEKAETEGEEGKEDGPREELLETTLSNNFFIPLTLPSEGEREYYTAQDPEWQAMVKFSNDKKTHHKTHEALAFHCRDLASKQLAQQLGKVDVTKGRYWIETTFPSGPPPVYSMFGIELGDGYISLAFRPLSQKDYFRYQQTVAPSNALASVMAFNLSMFDFYRDYIKKVLTMDKADVIAGATQGIMNPKGTGSDGSTKLPTHGDEQSHSTSHDATPSVDTSKIGMPENPPVRGEAKIPDVPPPSSSEFRKSTHALINKLRMSKLKNKRPEPPAGHVRFWGLIEVFGVKGKANLEVVCDYDIEGKAFTLQAISLQRVRPWQQSPKRPPQKKS